MKWHLAWLNKIYRLPIIKPNIQLNDHQVSILSLYTYELVVFSPSLCNVPSTVRSSHFLIHAFYFMRKKSNLNAHPIFDQINVQKNFLLS